MGYLCVPSDQTHETRWLPAPLADKSIDAAMLDLPVLRVSDLTKRQSRKSFLNSNWSQRDIKKYINITIKYIKIKNGHTYTFILGFYFVHLLDRSVFWKRKKKKRLAHFDLLELSQSDTELDNNSRVVNTERRTQQYARFVKPVCSSTLILSGRFHPALFAPPCVFSTDMLHYDMTCVFSTDMLHYDMTCAFSTDMLHYDMTIVFSTDMLHYDMTCAFSTDMLHYDMTCVLALECYTTAWRVFLALKCYTTAWRVLLALKCCTTTWRVFLALKCCTTTWRVFFSIDMLHYKMTCF